MKVQINSCSASVTERLGDSALVNLKPRARVHHEYELTLPDGTEKHHIAPKSIGQYGHDEYTLPDGYRVVVAKLYGELHAYSK